MPCIQTPLRSLQISSTSPALRTTAESPLSAAAPRVSCPHTRGHRTNTKRAQLRSRRRAARSPSAHLQAALCLPDPLLTPSRSPAQHAPPATATSVPLPPRGVSRPGRPNREPAAPGAARPPLQHRRRPPSVIRREGRRGRTGGAALPWGSLLQPEVPADAAAPEVLPGRPNRVPPPSPAARRPRPALTCPPAPPAAARQPQPHGAPGARARQLRPGPVPAAAHGPRSAERRSSPPGMPAAGRGATTAAAPAAPPGGSEPLVFPGGDPPAARSSRVRTKPPRRRCRKSPRPSPPPPRPAASRSYDGVSCRAPLLPGVGTDPRLKASLEPGAPRRLRASSPGDGRHSLGHREHCIRVQILVIRRRRS